MNLLPTKKNFDLLQKAWDLDQQALLNTKNKHEANLLWKQSINICDKLLKKYPRDINLLTKIATIYQHQNKFEKAKIFLNKAKKYYDKNFLIYHSFGNLYRAMDNPKLALKYYELSFKYSNENKIIKKSLEDYRKILLKAKSASALKEVKNIKSLNK